MEDVFERFPSLPQQEHLKLLSQKLVSEEATELLLCLRNGANDTISAAYLGLSLTYADIVVEEIVFARKPVNKQIGDILFNLMNSNGYPGVDDKTSPRVLSFWMSYVEFVQNAEGDFPGDTKPGWLKTSYQRILDIVWLCLTKVCWPADGSTDDWDTEDLSQFKAFRVDVQDLVQTVYTILGIRLMNELAERAISLQHSSDWPKLEAILFALNALADSSAPHEESANDALSALFSSTLFDEHVFKPKITKLKKTKLRTVSLYAIFFENHPRYLSPLLNWLFDMLKDPEVGEMAAQSIATICSVCRAVLVPELDTLLQNYLTLLRDESFRGDPEEKLMTATVSIIQALASEESKAELLKYLIETVNVRFNAGVNNALVSTFHDFNALWTAISVQWRLATAFEWSVKCLGKSCIS